VTHPFHPLFGREFVLVDLRLNWGENRVCLHDEDGALARARLLIAAEPYVRELTTDGDQIRLYVEDGSAALPGLLRLLDRERIALKSVSLSEPTLDDVFVHYTGHQLRDALQSAAAYNPAFMYEKK